jgi:hypothetical protein
MFWTQHKRLRRASITSRRYGTPPMEYGGFIGGKQSDVKATLPEPERRLETRTVTHDLFAPVGMRARVMYDVPWLRNWTISTHFGHSAITSIHIHCRQHCSPLHSPVFTNFSSLCRNSRHVWHPSIIVIRSTDAEALLNRATPLLSSGQAVNYMLTSRHAPS